MNTLFFERAQTACTASTRTLVSTCLIALLAQPAFARDDAAYGRANGLDISYRDMGVIIHHTRVPFKTRPGLFTKHLNADPNWTQPTIVPNMTRAAHSAGIAVTNRALPIDVAMTALWPKGTPGSTCVVSYRGTDQDNKYDPSLNYLIRVKEGLIPLSTAGVVFRGTGESCKMKRGYYDNYQETRPQVMRFLNEAVSEGQCSRGILFLGMSLGGATASTAFTDLMMGKAPWREPRRKSLIEAKKVWVVTAGAPRALSQECASRVESIAGDRVKRFIYGSFSDEAREQGNPNRCARYIDPVPGNPEGMSISLRKTFAGHFGRAIVGHNTYTGTNPNTPSLSFAQRQLCRQLAHCKSKRFANRLSRVATRSANFVFPSNPGYPVIGRDSGASCSAPGLIPGRKYMFGRFHDTCSYRNVMAAYGQQHAGEPVRTNYKCNFPTDSDETSKYPRSTCPLGRDAAGVELCAAPAIDPDQLQQR